MTSKYFKYTHKEQYRHYCENTSDVEKLTWTEWRVLMQGLMDKIRDKVVFEGVHYTHPLLGDFYLAKWAIRGNLAQNEAYVKLVGNDQYRFKWNKKFATFQQKNLYRAEAFTRTRQLIKKFNIQKEDGTINKPKMFNNPFKKFIINA